MNSWTGRHVFVSCCIIWISLRLRSWKLLVVMNILIAMELWSWSRLLMNILIAMIRVLVVDLLSTRLVRCRALNLCPFFSFQCPILTVAMSCATTRLVRKLKTLIYSRVRSRKQTLSGVTLLRPFLICKNQKSNLRISNSTQDQSNDVASKPADMADEAREQTGCYRWRRR